MAEATVVGHIGDGVAVIYQHIHVRQGGQRCAECQRFAALPAAKHGALDRGAENELSN